MEENTSKRLKKALELRNMKQIELSEKTGIGKSAISQYLAGKVVPKQDKIYLIAKALNVNEGWLMGYDIPINTSSIDTLANKIKKLSSDKQKEVESIVDNLSSDETIAAHRTDDPMNELPEDARKSIEDFKKFIFEKYGIRYN